MISLTIAPQIVHVCNHIIETYQKKLGMLTMTHGTSLGDDEVSMGIMIEKVYNIYSVINENNLDYRFYRQGTDYNIVNKNLIKWISDNHPGAGETYYLECYYTIPDIQEYESEDCPRCLNNGWYVDLMPQSEMYISELSGMNKIVQDFIKMIFTYQSEENLYGTKIVDYAGQVITNLNQTCSEITSILYSAADRYKELQMASMLDGNQLADDEILDHISIDSIEYDEDSGGIYVDLVLFSRSGVQSEVGIGI